LLLNLADQLRSQNMDLKDSNIFLEALAKDHELKDNQI
jgi:hypothetical protein